MVNTHSHSPVLGKKKRDNGTLFVVLKIVSEYYMITEKYILKEMWWIMGMYV